MKNIITFVAIGLLVGLTVGYFSFSSKGIDEKEKTMHSEDDSAVATMAKHSQLEIDSTKPIPTVSVEAIKDMKGGYNIHIITSNYKWTPEKVNKDPIQGEGHAHIYVNNVKVARIYGEWFYLEQDNLKDGENTVEVTLNANDHSEWVQDGQHLSGEVVVAK